MKLLLVDDHPVLRDGVALLVASEFPHVQLIHASSLADALLACATHADLGAALLDLNLPDADGLRALVTLHHAYPGLTIVVMSAEDSRERIVSAMDAGAAGYIAKSSPSGDLLAALRQVLNGGVCLPPCVIQEAGARVTKDPPASNRPAIGLTPRQLDVLWLLIQGRSNKLICRELGLSEATVKTHLESSTTNPPVATLHGRHRRAVCAAVRQFIRHAGVPSP